MTYNISETFLSHYAEKINEAKFWEQKEAEADAQWDVAESRRCMMMKNRFKNQAEGMLEALEIFGYTVKETKSKLGFGTEFYLDEI